MPKKNLPTRLLTAMMATGLMLATTAALAQSQTRADERRAERAKRSGAETKEQRYPEATREDPEARPTRTGSTRLNKLSDAYEAQDVPQTQVLADEILADEKSNSYEKSMAARIAGAALIGQDDAKALDYFQRALQSDGLKNDDHYEVMSIIAQLHAQDDRYDEALATMERLQTETRSQDPNLLAHKDNIQLRKARYTQAIDPPKP